MKRYKWLFISLGGFFAVILVTVVLFLTGILRPAMFGTFELAKDSRREFVVEQSLQAVAMNLMKSNIRQKMLERLNVKVLKSEIIKENLNMTQIFSGKWSAEMEEESKIEMNDPRMGRMTFSLRTSMKADPGRILIVTELSEPTEIVKRFEQSIMLTPEGEEKSGGGLASMFVGSLASAAGLKGKNGPPKTKFEIAYSSEMVIPYPGFSFIRTEAQRQVEAEHVRVLDVMEEMFREYCGK